MPTPVEQLRKQCEDYKAHLKADIRRLAPSELSTKDLEEGANLTNLAGLINSIDALVDGEVNPTLLATIEKLEVVNKMLGALNNKDSTIDDTKRIKNMASILTQDNQAILKSHRATGPGSVFLQAIFDILFSILHQDVRPKTTGQILADKILALKNTMENPTAVEHPATAVPSDDRSAEADHDDEKGTLFYPPPEPPSTLPKGNPDDEVLDLGKTYSR